MKYSPFFGGTRMHRSCNSLYGHFVEQNNFKIIPAAQPAAPAEAADPAPRAPNLCWGQYWCWKGIAEGSEPLRRWNLLLARFFWLTSSPQDCRGWGSARLPCSCCWRQGGCPRAAGLRIAAPWELTWLKIRFGEGCWGGGQAERSLVSVLSGWLGYWHDLTASGCQTVLK